MGMLARGRAQLSMNLTDFEVTPISQVYRAVSELALRHKAGTWVEGEVIGLIPEAACERQSEWMRQLVWVPTPRPKSWNVASRLRLPGPASDRPAQSPVRQWPGSSRG